MDEFARTIPDHPAFRDLAPISLVRALSQSRNPRGEPDDTALLVAMCDQSCVGYHGLLPGLLKNNDNTSKVSWLVTFYLDPGHRGKGYGKRLVSEIQNENIDLVTTGITRGAEGVYRSAGFKQLGELPYYQLRLERLRFLKRFSYPADSETAVLAIFNPLKRLGDWSYRLTKSIAYRVAFQKLKSNKKPFKSKPVHQLAKELTAIVERQSLPVSFYCNIDRINWMLRHPWVVSRGEAKKDVTNYYFSIVRDQFKFVPFEIYTTDGKTSIGYVVLSLSSKKNKTTVKILNYGFNDPDDNSLR